MTAPAPRAAARRYRRQQKLVAVGLAQAKHTWAARSFRALAAVMSILQYEAAVAAVLGDEEMLEEQGVDAPPGYELVPEAFSGRTAAGGDLESFLEAAASLEQLEMAIITEINDAARTAAGTDIVSRPAVEGHIRYLNPPSCSRCTVLAGRFYKWSDGFLRHPLCDCGMIPVSEAGVGDYERDPMEAFRRGEISDLTEAEARAITDGADISQVINVRRKAAGLREAGLVLDRLGRLTPEGIYRIASDRDEALRLLTRFGYLQ